MQKTDANLSRCGNKLGRWLVVAAAIWILCPASKALGADTSDPVLSLMLEKGMITETEAAKVQAQVDARRTNPVAVFPESKWKISSAIKNMEIFGDVRLRYEGRTVADPGNGHIDLNRLRYAVRLGLRGDLFDDFYYGLRVETSANPRSSFVTFGQSANGPFSKSSAGINIGQVYLGWHPENWFDITLGKMPNPLSTSTMVWSPSLNPEGAVEQFKLAAGEADFFANFAQFLYQDNNPTSASKGYFDILKGDGSDLPFLMVLQGGVNYHVTKEVSFKVAPAYYSYFQFKSHSPIYNYAPDFSGTYVGQGVPFGINGPAYYNLGGLGYDGFAANQTGINNLSIIEIPFELNVKLKKVDLRLFGDYAQNLEGGNRANAAYNVANSGFFSPAGTAGYSLIHIPSAQTHDNIAYQFGLAVGSKDSLGLVNGAAAKKHSWEVRTYWQHVEQYSLDPNLLDLDFFEGVENLEGIYFAAAYALTDNFIGTVRYGHAQRINNNLGTGGSGMDIPQMNPINDYDLFQVDLTFKF